VQEPIEVITAVVRHEVNEHPAATQIDPDRDLIWERADGPERPFADGQMWQLVGRILARLER
jgi:hypothetical protein